ncbi:hypothetical protein JHK82_048423 [Glycine max]|nr:hypothetical protein JHK82_048423 [Glycine max]
MKGSEVRVFDFREEDTTRHRRGKSDDKKHNFVNKDGARKDRLWTLLFHHVLGKHRLILAQRETSCLVPSLTTGLRTQPSTLLEVTVSSVAIFHNASPHRRTSSTDVQLSPFNLHLFLDGVVLDKEVFQKQMLEKLIWICSVMLVGAPHGGVSVGVVDKEFRTELSSLITELALATSSEKGLTFEEAMEERLCAYSQAVAHFSTPVKEVNDTI